MTKPILRIRLEGEDSVERVAKQLRFMLEKTRVLDIYKRSLEFKSKAEKKREQLLKAIYRNQKRLEEERRRRR